MKAELTLPEELIEQIVDRLLERLKPMLSANSNQEGDYVLLDVDSLAKYLKVSEQWIYQRTQHNEIPFYKMDGLVRFRKSEIDKWLLKFNTPAVCMPEKPFKKLKAATSCYR